MTSVLVTGGAGFIGSHLVDALLNQNYKVKVLDNLSSGRIENIAFHRRDKNFRFELGSILNQANLMKAMRGVHTVFHEAAVVSVVRSIRNPKFVAKVNFGGTLNVLEGARKSSVEKVIIASSAAVYGGRHMPPLTENVPPEPDSPYGASKSAAEALCLAYAKTYGLKTVALRYANVYGPRRSPGMYAGVMMNFAKAMSHQRQPVIFGDGDQTRDFISVLDVARANILAMRKDLGASVINVGTGRPTSVQELAKLFASTMGFKGLSPIYQPARKGEIRHNYLSVSLAKRRLQVAPRVNLKDGIRQFLKWYSSSTK